MRLHQFATLLLLSFIVPVFASETKVDFSELEKIANAELKEKGIPGAAIGIVSGDKLVFAKAFGVASVETGAPLTAEMLFRLGSTTKMFTAAAVVTLSEEGELKLGTPVSQYIKGLDSKIGQVTAHQLLSQTSGLHDESPMYGRHDDVAMGAVIRGWKRDQFFTDPGKIYSYSNPGYWLAGFLVAEVSGKFYADAMHDLIFSPIGMERTTFRPTTAMTYPFALGHETLRGKPVVVRPFADNAAAWPAGSIFSNVEDLSRFVIAFLNDGQIDGKQVLSPSLIAQLSSPHTEIPGDEAQYGYGLVIGKNRGVRVLSHTGSRSGYGSLIRMAPDQHFGLIILANLTGAQLPRTAEKAYELFLPFEAVKGRERQLTPPLTISEMGQYAGAYSNGSDREIIFFEDGKIFLKRSIAKLPLRKVGEHRLIVEKASSPAERLFFLTRTDGRVEYLFRAGRALKKEPHK